MKRATQESINIIQPSASLITCQNIVHDYFIQQYCVRSAGKPHEINNCILNVASFCEYYRDMTVQKCEIEQIEMNIFNSRNRCLTSHYTSFNHAALVNAAKCSTLPYEKKGCFSALGWENGDPVNKGIKIKENSGKIY